MPRQTKQYTLPIIGTMLDWDTISGDPTDAIRPVRVHSFMSSHFGLNSEDNYNWPPSVPVGEGWIKTSTVEIKSDMTAIVEIDAPVEFHGPFTAWLQTRDHDQVAQDLAGRPRATVPADKQDSFKGLRVRKQK